MITGFNTDIDCEGITYHIQTEDKGLATPLILSLVYNGGTILASKRSPYEDLLVGDFDEQALIERLQKQHKLMCAAVRAGRIEDLKRMTMKDSASRQKGLVAQKEVKSIVEKKETTQPTEVKNDSVEFPVPQILKEKSQPFKKTLANQIALDEQPTNPAILPGEDMIWDIPLKILEERAAEFVEIVGEEMILPAEAVEIITDLAKNEQSDDKLRIELLNEETYKGGERKTVRLLVRRGNQEQGLGGAQILVKVIGSSFRPLIFHAKTDSSGFATVHLQLPHFKAGRAAVLLRAMSEGEETELRRTIQQG